MRYSPFRHLPSALLKTQPVHLTLFLTDRCDSRCRFCFYLSRESRDRRRQSGDLRPELSLAEIEKISASLGSLLWLAFSGGEPFLRQDLAEIAEAFYRRNRPCFILIPTNGLRTEPIVAKTEEILKRCSRSTVVVKLSLDGPEEVHDRLRGVPGAFKRTRETFDRLRELAAGYPNFELGINSVLCSENQDCMDGLITTVGRMSDVRTHTVSLIRGEVHDRRLKEVDPGVYAAVGNRLAQELRRKAAGRYGFRGGDLKAAQDILQRRLIHRTQVEQKQQVPCVAGRLSLVLTETGDAYPCESFSMSMGNVRDHACDVKNLLKADKARAAIRSVLRGCSCTHECSMMMNILFNPACYPALVKEYLKLAGRKEEGKSANRTAGAGYLFP